MIPLAATVRLGAVRYNFALVNAVERQPAPSQDDATRADIRLMERIVSRDTMAVGELYDRHNRLIFGLLLRILGQRNDAEEVLQDVFMAVWNRSETYSVALGTPVAWLVRVARNRAIDRLRANAVRARTMESVTADEPPPIETPEKHAAASERQRQVMKALEALPREQRELIEQAYFLGLTQTELAEQHRLPLGTVKTRIRSGMLTLRQSLSPM